MDKEINWNYFLYVMLNQKIVKGIMDIGKGPYPAEKGFKEWIGVG